MASISYAETVVRAISNELSSDVKTKFTNTDTGYASANGSLENGIRFNVIELDENSSRVVAVTSKTGDYTCECTFPTRLATDHSGRRAAQAFKAMS